MEISAKLSIFLLDVCQNCLSVAENLPKVCQNQPSLTRIHHKDSFFLPLTYIIYNVYISNVRIEYPRNAFAQLVVEYHVSLVFATIPLVYLIISLFDTIIEGECSCYVTPSLTIVLITYYLRLLTSSKINSIVYQIDKCSMVQIWVLKFIKSILDFITDAYLKHFYHILHALQSCRDILLHI